MVVGRLLSRGSTTQQPWYPRPPSVLCVHRVLAVPRSVRYVYQPMEAMHLVLVTNKASNILEAQGATGHSWCRARDEVELQQTGSQEVWEGRSERSLGGARKKQGS